MHLPAAAHAAFALHAVAPACPHCWALSRHVLHAAEGGWPAQKVAPPSVLQVPGVMHAQSPNAWSEAPNALLGSQHCAQVSWSAELAHIPAPGPASVPLGVGGVGGFGGVGVPPSLFAEGGVVVPEDGGDEGLLVVVPPLLVALALGVPEV
jgi:hypothetical protein